MYRAVEKYGVRLTAEERAELQALIGPSRVAAEKQLRARLLLKPDEGELGPAWLGKQSITAFGVSRSKIMRLRRKFVEEGFQAVLVRQTSTQPRRRKRDGQRRPITNTNATANLFMMFEPLAGKRHVKVTDRRTVVDYAHVIRDLVDVHYPHADKIVLVQDNLNTHKPASLYQAFPPEEARRLIEKLEIHYTPKHGSWLNMAATELGILSRQCLDRRIPDQAFLTSEVTTWEASRNAAECKVIWQVTTGEARVKLHRLSPEIASISSTKMDHETPALELLKTGDSPGFETILGR